MSPTRRDFIKTTAATAAAIAAAPVSDLALAQTLAAPAADPLALELANEALDAARSAGASYADVRVGRYRRQTIATRERQVSGVNDSESYGIGVRTLVNGCWGFAATSVMNRAGIRQAALEAVALLDHGEERGLGGRVAHAHRAVHDVQEEGAAAGAAHVGADGGADRAHLVEHALGGLDGALLVGEQPVPLLGDALLVELVGRRGVAHGADLPRLWWRFTLFTCSEKLDAKTCEPSLRETKNR